jgi:hypothetical protein
MPRKKILFPCLLMITAWVFIITHSSFKSPYSSFRPPTGYTGVNATFCNACHSGNPLNATGGLVFVTGLPTGTYTPGQQYNFSITIAHSAANRQRWGFSIIALNAAGTPVGSFSSNNPNAALNGNELSHLNAAVSALQASYTYNNLSWTAPASTNGNNQSITFYYVGNAANGLNNSGGDFIYSGTQSVTAAQPPCTTNNWTGTVSTAWENPANWSCGVVPDSTMNVTVQAPAVNYPVVNSIAYCKSITTSQGVQVVVSQDKKLFVTGRQ